MTGVNLGPFVFGADRVVAIAAAFAFMACLALWGWWTRRNDSAFDVPGYAVLVGWILAARAGFVLMHRDIFADHPLDILAVWQGGFSPVAGLVGAAGVICWAGLRVRRTILPLATAAAFAAATAALVPALLPPPGADSLPNMTFQMADGTPVSLADGDPRPLVVNLWATWCPPCRRELPMMMDVAAANPDARIIFANQGEALSDVRHFLDLVGLPQTGILMDHGSDLMRHFEAPGLPTTLFFDAKGNLTDAVTGEVSRAALVAGIANAR